VGLHLSNLSVSVLFFFCLFFSFHFISFHFFLSFLLSQPRAQVTFLDRSRRPMHQTRVSGQKCAFRGLNNIRLHLGVKFPPPKKKSSKWAEIGISRPNLRSRIFIKVIVCMYFVSDMKPYEHINFKAGQFFIIQCPVSQVFRHLF